MGLTGVRTAGIRLGGVTVALWFGLLTGSDGAGLAAEGPPPAVVSAPAAGCPLTGPLPAPTAAPTAGPAPGFADWLAGFRAHAIACGLAETGPALAALAAVSHDAVVARLDRTQPEYNSTFGDYLGRRVDAAVVARGQALATAHQALLAQLGADYGVPAEILLALWALESAYGAQTGDTPVLNALATLAFDGRRRDFYQRELLTALQLLDAGIIAGGPLRGSWAGAMGQMQFMPGTLAAHGRDGDGDGRLDLWTSVPDALTSAARYLAALGWQRDVPWGVEVVLPAGFDPRRAEVGDHQPVGEWSAVGVRLAAGGPLPASPGQGAIVLPSGHRGPAFLVYGNFDRLLDWNRSLFYALTVGVLADRLAGGPPLVGQPPPGERPLRRAEVITMQQALTALGFTAGEADGMVGAQTRAALRGWQAAQGMPADGYPTPVLIDRLLAQAGMPPTVPPAPDRAAIRSLQQGLNRLGYAAGAEDGLPGEQTRRALADWLAARGLPPVTEPDLVLIGRVTAEAALQAGAGGDGGRGD